MTSNNFDQQRLKDLGDNLAKEQDLLKQFEDSLRYESDPRIKARYQKDIERQKQAINQYQKEYQELKDKLLGNSPSQINNVSKGNPSDNTNNPRQSIFSNVNVGGSINIHGNITQQSNSDTILQNTPQTQNSNQSPSTIKIFLASSSELKEDREQFEIFIYRKCKEYKEEGIFLELVIWEDFIDAMSQTRLQDEYNKAITDGDIFVSLFFTKVGKYTKEEFLKAWDTFKVNNKPLIYTYFKDANIKTSEIKEDDILSLFNFKKQLKEKGHYPTGYTGIGSLKNNFGDQLTKLLPGLKESKKKSS
ncbi:MAG: hypothetical protein AB4372_18170 [Xenococcus sp. (in: cyanobacteria)]